MNWGYILVKSRREQVWFVALVFLGTGAVSVLAYLDQIGGSANERGISPFVEAAAGEAVRSAEDDLQPGLSKHYFNRQATLPSPSEPVPVQTVSADERSTALNEESKPELHATVQRKVSKNFAPAGASKSDRLAVFPADKGQRFPQNEEENGQRSSVDGTLVSNSPEEENLRKPSETNAATGQNASSQRPNRLRPYKAAAPSPNLAKRHGTTHRPDSKPLPGSTRNSTSMAPLKQKPTASVSKKDRSERLARKQKPKHSQHQRGWLPTENLAPHERGHAPLKALIPRGQGWVEPSADLKGTKTRFGDVERPTPPGSGPVFATGRHPGLLGVMDGHDEPVHGVRFAPSGETLVSAAESGQIRHWDAQKGLVTQSLAASAPLLLAADWSQDWQTLAILGCTPKACALDVRAMDSGQNLQNIAVHRAHIGSVALSPNGELAAIATDDGRVSVTALGTDHQLSWRAHEAGVWTIAFDPFGRYLATGGTDYQVKIWEPRTGSLVRSLREQKGAIHTVAFAPNGLYIATAGADSVVRLYRASTGKLIRQFTGHLGSVRSLSFDASGRRLASAGDHSVRIWEIRTGQELSSIGWDFAITALAFSPDGTKLLAGDVVGLLTLWDAQIGSAGRSARTASR